MTDRITSPFGAYTAAREVTAGHDLTGVNAIVTGGASGIGVETARALAKAGAEVTLAVRNQAAGDGDVAADINAGTNIPRSDGGQARPFRPGLGARLRRRVGRGAAAHPDQQRRGHGPAP